MAPMFLVSNVAMMKAAMKSGVMGVFPSLNYRKSGELEKVLIELNEFKASNDVSGNYGVNLIVQGSNPMLAEHTEVCMKHKVPFYITSLGNPAGVIAKAHEYGGKVYCDVVNLEHAAKCAKVGCDGFIAVGQGAGGHAGSHPLHVFMPALKKRFPHIPVIAAGGIANGQSMLSMFASGADGYSIGTRFIASTEAGVNDQYKQAIVNSGIDDIVMTEKLSGTPCSVINTPYAMKIGLKQSAFERFLSKNPRTKKYFKMLVQYQGMKKLEESILPNNYKTLWSAGKSVELIDEVISCEAIVEQLIREFDVALSNLSS
jgi:nitronate monooxygenase